MQLNVLQTGIFASVYMFFFNAEQLWVLDSIPGEVNADDSDGEVEKVLKTLENLPTILPSRRLVIDYFYILWLET